jgi:hypothetical protein
MNDTDALMKDARTLVTDELAKQVYFYCDNNSPQGLHVDECDILEYGQKLVAVVGRDIARFERTECIKFVESLNKEVAQALKDRRGFL